MKVPCAAIKPNGERCRVAVNPPGQYCWGHDPVNANTRKKIASKAGRTKPGSKEIAELKARLRELSEGVLTGAVEREVGIAVAQITNAHLRALSVELKVREAEEFAQRLERLEALAERDQGRRRSR